jgi:hypothetical protein
VLNTSKGEEGKEGAGALERVDNFLTFAGRCADFKSGSDFAREVLVAAGVAAALSIVPETGVVASGSEEWPLGLFATFLGLTCEVREFMNEHCGLTTLCT